MISLPQLATLAAAALFMAVTPGPNMIYLISRSICQGRAAGVISWLGVALGLTVHMLCASVGLTALFMALPLSYKVVKFTGALYLSWLAWQAVKPDALSPFEATDLSQEPPHKLFVMGLLTSILNPNVVTFYCSSTLVQSYPL